MEDFEQARALFLDGLGCFEGARFDAAEQRFRASLALVPGRVSTLVNLAATLLKLARPDEALALADELLAIEPDNVDAWFHRGVALADLGRPAPALAAFDRVLAIDNRLAGPWFRHGQTLQSLDRHEEALASYEKALTLDPGLTQAWSNRGGILRESNRLAEATHAFEQAIAHGADPELHAYYLASVGARSVPPTAPPHYVESLFDAYADEFDKHLLGVLCYQAHTALIGGLRGVAPRRFGLALDLGCGTGLCGPLIKPLAERLVGIDLSGRMIEQAFARGVYDELAHADIVLHLRGTGQRYDLVVAADVFIYVGDLAPIFEAVHATMNAGGVFCFSAEPADPSVRDFELSPSLRYAHSERSVRELAGRCGFEVLALLRRPIRHEQSRAIEGLFVYLGRR
jgi:predicted TPR repeat methyltransferase